MGHRQIEIKRCGVDLCRAQHRSHSIMNHRCCHPGLQSAASIINSDGFTLIELLVVIAVIAILLAIFVPVMRTARERGQRAVCLSNLKHLTIAWTLYADDYEGQIVTAHPTVTGFTQTGQKKTTQVGWVSPINVSRADRSELMQNQEKGALWPYVQDVDLYRCPRGRPGSVVTYEIVSSANGSLLNGIGCDYQTYLNAMSSSGMSNSVGGTVLRLNWLTDIRNPPPGQRAVFIDQGYLLSFYYVPYLEPKWSRQGPPPIHHAEGATLSMADGHAEYWRWKARETVGLTRTQVPTYDDHTVELLTSDYEPQTEDGLQDLQRVQRAVWGRLGYSPDEAR